MATTEQLSQAKQLREEAHEADRRVEESWERSDTDGFLTQWAGGLTAQLKRRQAEILENGGQAVFPGLFVRETGERVKAKVVYVANRFSYVEGSRTPMWLVLDENDRALLWLPAYKGGSKRSKLYKLGFEERDEMAPAEAKIEGVGRGLSGHAWVATKRTDEGYPDDAKVVRR